MPMGELSLELVAPIIVMLVVLVGLFWLMVLRPAQSRQRRHQDLIEELRAGDKIVTVGGIYGRITRVGEKTIDVEVGGLTLKMDRRAVRRKQSGEGV